MYWVFFWRWNMSNLVYKDNNLIEASYSLNLSEQRLILTAIVVARDFKTDFTSETLLTIHASEYMERFGVGRQSAYEALQSACESLFERRLIYRAMDPETGKLGVYKSRWVSKIGYIREAGCVQLMFAPDVIPLFMRLEQKFTKYELKQISSLTSVYAIRLYELLMRWRGTGKYFTVIAELREKLGLLENEYKVMGDFKKRVLNLAVTQINEFTDVTVHYEQKKEGRSITEIHFFFSQKKMKDVTGSAGLPDYVLSEKQCESFARKLCDLNNTAFCSKHAEVGETRQAFEKRIYHELKNPKYVKQHLLELEHVGFKLNP